MALCSQLNNEGSGGGFHQISSSTEAISNRLFALRSLAGECRAFVWAAVSFRAGTKARGTPASHGQGRRGAVKMENQCRSSFKDFYPMALDLCVPTALPTTPDPGAAHEATRRNPPIW